MVRADCSFVPLPSSTSVVRFRSALDAVLHGFGGYFDCQLYDQVSFSIHPATHSEGMFSWFPMYIPLRAPGAVAAGSVIEAHFWRKSQGSKVCREGGRRDEDGN